MTGQFTLASVEEDPLEEFPITYRRVSDGAQGVGPVQQWHLVCMYMYMFICTFEDLACPTGLPRWLSW